MFSPFPSGHRRKLSVITMIPKTLNRAFRRVTWKCFLLSNCFFKCSIISPKVPAYISSVRFGSTNVLCCVLSFSLLE